MHKKPRQSLNLVVTETSELRGCITHGDSHTDALSDIKEAIDLWIKTAKGFDDPVPNPKCRRLLFA
ncbi:MAG TPA: type II toxin-antitoxin system HicB family antitoxin [Candidatus Wujingus californicus]